jgi:predicted transcriptional regulator
MKIYFDNIEPVKRSKLARRENPQTSHDAGLKAEKFAASHAGKILDALKQHGAMTVKEIADCGIGLNQYQIGKRMAALEGDLLIERASAMGERMTRDGCTIWEAL